MKRLGVRITWDEEPKRELIRVPGATLYHDVTSMRTIHLPAGSAQGAPRVWTGGITSPPPEPRGKRRRLPSHLRRARQR